MTMWVLLWFHIQVGLDVESFQIGSYESMQKCIYAAGQAKVMKTDQNMSVKCVSVNIIGEDK